MPNIQKAGRATWSRPPGKPVPPLRKEKNKTADRQDFFGQERCAVVLQTQIWLSMAMNRCARAFSCGHGIVEASLRRGNRAALTPVEAAAIVKVEHFFQGIHANCVKIQE